MALILLLTSCDQQGEMEILESSNSSIQIDKSKQIILQPTTLTKSEISEASCGESKVVTLTAGQHIDVGTVTVSNDETNLYVVYETTGNWVITETHLYVGTEAGIPLNGGGNPKIGHFPYHGNDDSPFTIPLAGLGDEFVIVAHAVVKKVIDGQTVQSETAFGCGEFSFPGNRWGCYFDYEKQECEEDKCMDAFAYKTARPKHSHCFLDDGFTQVGWTNNFSYRGLSIGHYQFPLYVNTEECDPTIGGQEVGYIDMITFSTEDGLFTTVTYNITSSDYVLNEVNLFIGLEKYPRDASGNFTTSPDAYTYNAVNLDENELTKKSYSFTKPWPGQKYDASFHDVYVIPYAKICLVN